MVLGESAKALTSFTSARFSFSRSGGRDGRLCRSSVQRIDSNEAPPSGIEASSETSFCNVVGSLIFTSRKALNLQSEIMLSPTGGGILLDEGVLGMMLWFTMPFRKGLSVAPSF